MKPHTKAIIGIAIAISIAVAAWCVWQTWPSDASGMRHTAVVVEQTTWHEVTVDNRPVLYFDSAEGDSALTGITSVREATHRRLTMGFWTNSLPLMPSCRGRVVAPYTAEGGVSHSLNDSAIVRLCRLSADIQLKKLLTQKSELDYYIRVHGVQDNGYQQIAALASSINSAVSAVRAARSIIDSLTADKHHRHHFALCTKATFSVTGHDADGKTVRLPMRLVSRDTTMQLAVLQTSDSSTPDWAKPAKLLPWNASTPRPVLSVATPGLGIRGIESDTVSPIIVQGTMQASGLHNLPRLLAPDGAPVYTRRGHFIGVVNGKKIISRSEINKLLKK